MAIQRDEPLFGIPSKGTRSYIEYFEGSQTQHSLWKSSLILGYADDIPPMENNSRRRTIDDCSVSKVDRGISLENQRIICTKKSSNQFYYTKSMKAIPYKNIELVMTLQHHRVNLVRMKDTFTKICHLSISADF